MAISLKNITYLRFIAVHESPVEENMYNLKLLNLANMQFAAILYPQTTDEIQ